MPPSLTLVRQPPYEVVAVLDAHDLGQVVSLSSFHEPHHSVGRLIRHADVAHLMGRQEIRGGGEARREGKE